MKNVFVFFACMITCIIAITLNDSSMNAGEAYASGYLSHFVFLFFYKIIFN